MGASRMEQARRLRRWARLLRQKANDPDAYQISLLHTIEKKPGRRKRSTAPTASWNWQLTRKARPMTKYGAKAAPEAPASPCTPQPEEPANNTRPPKP